MKADEIEEAVAWRRDLHRHPELAFEEHRTADFVARMLASFGLKVSTGLAGTGVVGTLTRGSSARSIGIRADMDALPIEELGAAPYKSLHPGKMHACGHDGHVTMLLAAARACAESGQFDGTVHFIFQPAEESEGGGWRMVEDGLFKSFPCDAVYGLHNWPSLPVGSCVARDTAMMAALGIFEIVIEGRGSHGAMPHEGVDPIVAACELGASLQTVVSRNVSPLEPAVVSITQIHAGDAWNVIPASCTLRGTTRWFDNAVGDLIETRLMALANSVADGFGCKATIRYERRYPPTINDPVEAAFIRSVASAQDGIRVEDVAPSMAAEDFSFMLEARPGCYLWLGSGRTGSDPGLHSPYFDFNDEIIPLGVDLWRSVVETKLAVA
ncbi:M20 aminoacylase family protein [Microvirga massiliensis]|uniref:M20 aminoacylase family protein n=1 Tax=Microvirga massiliensis TaxID=1033741 RepID=UPI00062B3421|nr:M20 aminoacylase family protein [Microvirga massiliensis]